MNRKNKQIRLVPPKRIELEYQQKLYRWIRFVTQFMQENVRPFLREWVEIGTREMRGDSVERVDIRDIDRVFNRLEQTSNEMFGQAWQETISYETASTTNAFNADKNGKAIKRVLGVDILASEPWLMPRVEAFVSTNADLITSLQREHIRKIKLQVINVVEKGITGADFAKEIERQFGVELAKSTSNVQARARLIARDQVSKFNGKLTETRQTAAGFTHYIWSTSGDERVRDSHREKNGQTFAWAEPPADTGHPGDDFQCLPGDTIINGFPNCEILYRRWYGGKLTHVIAENGMSLKCTANHPILTIDGLKPANEIKVGDQIVHIAQESVLVKRNANNVGIKFRDLFISSMIFGINKSTGKGAQFHGDGIEQNEVDVIRLAGDLTLKRNIVKGKIFSKLVLAFSNMVRSGGYRSENSATSFGGHGLWSALYSGMCSLGLSFALLGSHFAPFYRFSLRLRSWLYAMEFQVAVNDVSRGSKLFSNLISAVPGIEKLKQFVFTKSDSVGCAASNSIVSFYAESPELLAQIIRVHSNIFPNSDKCVAGSYTTSKVISILQDDFSGHVYNLQSSSGYYIANNIVVGNCRCVALPIMTPDMESDISLRQMFNRR